MVPIHSLYHVQLPASALTHKATMFVSRTSMDVLRIVTVGIFPEKIFNGLDEIGVEK